MLSVLATKDLFCSILFPISPGKKMFVKTEYFAEGFFSSERVFVSWKVFKF